MDPGAWLLVILFGLIGLGWLTSPQFVGKFVGVVLGFPIAHFSDIIVYGGLSLILYCIVLFAAPALLPSNLFPALFEWLRARRLKRETEKSRRRSEAAANKAHARHQERLAAQAAARLIDDPARPDTDGITPLAKQVAERMRRANR